MSFGTNWTEAYARDSLVKSKPHYKILHNAWRVRYTPGGKLYRANAATLPEFMQLMMLESMLRYMLANSDVYPHKTINKAWQLRHQLIINRNLAKAGD